MGTALNALAPASPLLLDRTSVLTIALANANQALSGTTLSALVQGANLALVGHELLQFARAESLGSGVWRLSHFLRGCGGTEAGIVGHLAGEPFALVNARLAPLDTATVGSGEATTIFALGRSDAEPVAAPLRLEGLGARPLAPVHGRAQRGIAGSLRLTWTRRTRGGWRWSDGVDMPLAEESERYLVTFEASSQPGCPPRGWTVDVPTLDLTADDLATLVAQAPDGVFHIRQQGTRALSLPLVLPRLL